MTSLSPLSPDAGEVSASSELIRETYYCANSKKLGWHLHTPAAVMPPPPKTNTHSLACKRKGGKR
jgi:hypothetical protein